MKGRNFEHSIQFLYEYECTCTQRRAIKESAFFIEGRIETRKKISQSRKSSSEIYNTLE